RVRHGPRKPALRLRVRAVGADLPRHVRRRAVRREVARRGAHARGGDMTKTQAHPARTGVAIAFVLAAVAPALFLVLASLTREERLFATGLPALSPRD